MSYLINSELTVHYTLQDSKLPSVDFGSNGGLKKVRVTEVMNLLSLFSLCMCAEYLMWTLHQHLFIGMNL